MFLHGPLSGLSSDVERLNSECSKKYVSFYSDDFKLIGIFFKPGRSLLNKKGYQEINLLVRIQLSSHSPDLSLERANAIQDGSKSIKKARLSGLFYHSGAAAPLRIFFCLLTVWSVSC